MYSALAGFVEPGETLEQCVEREVQEEVGVRVRNLRYFGSQPWPFPHSLMIAFHAEFDSGEIRIDGVEIEDAQWFSIVNLPRLPARISIARRLIDSALGEMQAAQKRGSEQLFTAARMNDRVETFVCPLSERQRAKSGFRRLVRSRCRQAPARRRMPWSSPGCRGRY